MANLVLSGDDILRLLSGNPPLIEDMPDAQQQVQPNGVDLTVRDVALITSTGAIDLSNKDRVLSSVSPLTFDNLGRIHLVPGCYLITYNEIVHLPRSLMALGFPRSSLTRCGVTVHTAIWDAGYSGRSQSLLVVYNSQGFHLYQNARVLQLIFLHLGSEVAEGYKGIFHGENI